MYHVALHSNIHYIKYTGDIILHIMVSIKFEYNIQYQIYSPTNLNLKVVLHKMFVFEMKGSNSVIARFQLIFKNVPKFHYSKSKLNIEIYLYKLPQIADGWTGIYYFMWYHTKCNILIFKIFYICLAIWKFAYSYHFVNPKSNPFGHYWKN